MQPISLQDSGPAVPPFHSKNDKIWQAPTVQVTSRVFRHPAALQREAHVAVVKLSTLRLCQLPAQVHILLLHKGSDSGQVVQFYRAGVVKLEVPLTLTTE